MSHTYSQICLKFGHYGNTEYGLWSLQTGGTKLERFLPKNQHTQRKLLNFENWVNGEVPSAIYSESIKPLCVLHSQFPTKKS